MITPEQEAWINTLSDRTISIFPYDPKAEELFKVVSDKIHDLLGEDVLVEHSGSTIFGIAGQDEIDVAVVASKAQFADYIPKLETIFGPVRSSYPDRARFEVKEAGKKIDLKIVDVDHPNYREGKIFEDYLKTHPADLEYYKVFKEESDGLTLKEYYRRKIEFTNEILAKAGVQI
ncbi:MAG: hypothetical protein A2571_02270 [Candidatus Vogelbacteria bacterium RIFOXYD1_FULL_44_32]|uniref:GrpB family protein n=1 Tax=Candidatus Vogelbacteria bacterium RIFOXYD1_FULL_44_32 TaxID=1802438 RepID=A0A1G2QEZ9_9BACT|nr:MAG: hypothetical protein A2571_02270 [Candidatus Vogelbacteria bacterium RIFOXYD1_FULL_44_32]